MIPSPHTLQVRDAVQDGPEDLHTPSTARGALRRGSLLGEAGSRGGGEVCQQRGDLDYAPAPPTTPDLAPTPEPQPEPEPETLRPSELAEFHRRLSIVRGWVAQREAGLPITQGAVHAGVSAATLCRWAQAYDRGGADALRPGWSRCGRIPEYTPTPSELALVRAVYVRLNESRVRGRGRGSSKVTAFRLIAASDDPRVTEAFRRTVLRRESKTIPPSWERLLDTPASVLGRARAKGSTSSTYISTPRGMHYIDASGEERPVRAGTIWEADDGTVNFPVVVPWPYGGDPCSDRYGVKIGRFQLLAIVDVRTGFCPTWHYVIRAKSSYRGEDIVALFGEAFSSVGMPESLRLERGSWESHAVREAIELTGIPVLKAWESKQKGAVENFFDRLWTPLSLAPGDVGRRRGENEEHTDLVMRAEAGRVDPRQHFLSVEAATEAIGRAVAFVNGEPRESRSWGRWVPQALWTQQTSEHPLQKLDPDLKVFFSRERREWTVRKGCVGGRVETPQLRFPIYFQPESLWEFEGCKVRAYFDPFAAEVTGTLVLADEWRSYKPGHVIARDVPALDLPPQAVLAADYALPEEHARQLQVRKAMAKAVRTETWTYLGRRTSEARDGFGNTARQERGGPRPAPTPPAQRRPAAPPLPDDWRDASEPPAPSQGPRHDGFSVSLEELSEL